MSRIRPSEYRRAEARSSILMAPLVLYVSPPISQPSGGIPETTADAEVNKKTAEENKTPVRTFTILMFFV